MDDFEFKANRGIAILIVTIPLFLVAQILEVILPTDAHPIAFWTLSMIFAAIIGAYIGNDVSNNPNLNITYSWIIIFFCFFWFVMAPLSALSCFNLFDFKIDCANPTLYIPGSGSLQTRTQYYFGLSIISYLIGLAMGNLADPLKNKNYQEKFKNININDTNSIKILKIHPKKAEAYNKQGISYYKKGEYELAISNYTKAIELNPKSAMAYNNRGIIYYKKGVYNLAISDFTKAININPSLAAAYKNRGTVYYKKGDYNLAQKDYTMGKTLGLVELGRSI